MKVLTIKEPFASLIINGYKEYEFRTWKTKYRGDILIHASKTPSKKDIERFKYLNLDYSCGEIIGKVQITDCILIDKSFKDKLLKKDKEVYKNVEEKTYALKIENIEKFKTKIKVNGKLGIWNYK